MHTIITSEFWYALSQLGKVVKQSGKKDQVLSDEAFYYIKHVRSRSASGYSSSKYFIFNTSFEQVTLKYNGVIGKDVELKETASTKFKDGKRIRFTLVDRSDEGYCSDFGGGIDAFKDCIQFMDELGNYGSLKEMNLTKDLKKLQEVNKMLLKEKAELEKKNEDLQSKLDSIFESKSDLRKLTQLLYEN